MFYDMRLFWFVSSKISLILFEVVKRLHRKLVSFLVKNTSKSAANRNVHEILGTALSFLERANDI